MRRRTLIGIAAVVLTLAGPPAATAAYTSTISGTTVTMTGGATSDSLAIDQSGGLLRHNRFGDAGFNSAYDWSTSVGGDQTFSASNSLVVINVNAGDGNDSISLGSLTAPATAGQARVNVTGGAGMDAILWDDSADSTGRMVNLQGAPLHQFLPSTGFPTGWGGGGVEQVTVLAGSGSDIVAIEGSSAGVSTGIRGGGGADTFTVGVRSPYNSLDNLLGPVTVDGQAGTDALFVVDNGNPIGRTFAVGPTAIKRNAAALLGYSLFESLSLLLGPGSDTLTTTPGGQGFSVTGGNGNDSLMGGSGPDTLNGGSGNDVLKSRDAQLDTDICGDGSDSVAADTLDGVSPDCELVSRRPSLSNLAIAPKRFKPARGGGSIGTTRRGAIVTFRLSEDATVVFKVDRLTRGRRVGGRCVTETASNRTRARCTRVVHLRGSFSRASKLGKNTFQFTGRLRGKALTPGSYKLVAAPRLPNGRLGTKRSVAFTIRS